MSKKNAVGIDVGTYHIKVIVAEALDDRALKNPKIIGTGFSESRGIRHGYITNREETSKSIREALNQAEKMSGMKITEAHISVGGIGLSSVTSIGSIAISRADSEITELDIEKVANASKEEIPSHLLLNRKIVHTVPLQYKIDGRTVVGSNPVGQRGSKLEVKALYILCIEQHINELISAIEGAGVEVSDVIVSPIAASIVTLNKAQKIAGVVLANIGAETVSIVVFENNMPISLEVFPIGGTDITHDIALGLKIDLADAENIKRGNHRVDYSKKKLDEIIVARLTDIFELIENHLKRINRNGLLPAGIVITGGSSKIATIEDLAKASLNLPSRIATLHFGGNIKDLNDSVWSVAYGLCLLAITDDEKINIDIISKTKSGIVRWIKQFLP